MKQDILEEFEYYYDKEEWNALVFLLEHFPNSHQRLLFQQAIDKYNTLLDKEEETLQDDEDIQSILDLFDNLIDTIDFDFKPL